MVSCAMTVVDAVVIRLQLRWQSQEALCVLTLPMQEEIL